jgi:Kelch motif
MMEHSYSNFHNTCVMEWSECTQNVNSMSFGANGTSDVSGVRNVSGNSGNINGGDIHRHHMNVMHLPHNSHSVHHHHAAAAPTIKNHSVTHFNGYLYCFGGYDGRRNHMTLLLYSIRQQRWIRPHHVNVSSSNNNINATAIQSQSTHHAQQNRQSQSFVNQPSINNVSNQASDLYRVDLTNIGGSNGTNNGSGSNGKASGTGSDSSIIVQGTPPPGRNGHSATLATDPDDDEQGRIIIIGGWLGTGPLAASDMHVLDITHINSNHTNSGINNHGMNGDNGDDDTSNRNGAVCRQILQWYQPAVKGTPPGPCNMHSADYVLSRKEVYVFRGGNGREYLNDLHALHVDTLTWRKVHCTGAVPQQRANHSSAILDHPSSKKSELFIFGGWNGFERLNDIHILDTETSNWTAPHVGGVSVAGTCNFGTN